MANDIIQQRLATYQLDSIEDETDALKEILQEIILYGLSCTDFFNHAAFQGGTALRILYQLPRFSEDLDFILKEPTPAFNWQAYIEALTTTCREFGIEPEICDKSRADAAIQKLFLKDHSIGKLIDLHFKNHQWKKLRIKLEIDTNPPAGSTYKEHYVNFPLDYAVSCQDLPSNFAGKCHALLCRKYLKGRDWYDFTWYIKNNISPNLILLQNALNQYGPWHGEALVIDKYWLHDALTTKIKQINWEQAKADVIPFLGNLEKQSLSVWKSEFFLACLKKLFISTG